MKDIQGKIEGWIEDINYDLKQDWCKDKITPMIQLIKLQQALDLLKSVGDNGNIEN